MLKILFPGLNLRKLTLLALIVLGSYCILDNLLAAIGIGIVFAVAVSIRSAPLNPNVETLTGLAEDYWAQAQTLVDRYGTDATAVLAVRESHNHISEDQFLDYARTRTAADFILELKRLEKSSQNKDQKPA